MTTLPSRAAIISGTTTNAQQKINLGDMRDFIAQIAGSVGSGRRKNQNGDFSVNQRRKTGTVTLAAGERGHDFWRAGASGCVYTFATVDGLTTISISGGSLTSGIPGANLKTGVHVLSWEGTAQGRFGGGTYGATGVTGNLIGGVQADIEFAAGTLTLVQCEPGTQSSTYEYSDFELQKCQRFCPVFYGPFLFSGTAYASNQAFITIPFPVTTWTPPTGVVVSGATDFRLFSAAGGGLATTAVGFNEAGVDMASINVVVSTGLTGGNSTKMYQGPSGTPFIILTGAEI